MTKGQKFIEFANAKLVELENKLGVQIEGFNELYENLSQEDQGEFMELLKQADEEKLEKKSKHPCTRKPKARQRGVKHGRRKKK